MSGEVPVGFSAVDHDPFAEGQITRAVPTTESQREVWLADQLSTEASLAYNESVSLRLSGPLDVAALQAATQALLERHDALRAAFSSDGQTLYIADTASALAIGFTALDALPAAAREAVVAKVLRDEVDRGFDLEQGPLLRVRLLKLQAEEHLLVLTAHHIVCDGWSFGVLVNDLGQLYACQLGQAPGLPAAVSFADYALAQAVRAVSPEQLTDEAYWIGRFADGAPLLDLPTDRPRRAQRGFASQRLDFRLDAGLLGEVRKFGSRQGASLFSTLLGAFAATLQRVCGGDDFVVGVPAAGQSEAGWEGVVGHCVNLLPLRLRVDAAEPLGTLLASTQAAMLDAFEHQQYTFGTLLKKLVLPRELSRLPLVSVMFNLDQALDTARPGFPGLELGFSGNARTHENFELFVNAVQEDGGLRFECQYNTDLFDAATVQRWMVGFESLLRSACQSHEIALGDLPFASEADRALMLGWNATAAPFSRLARVHDLFEAQASRVPERVAVVAGSVTLTYAALDARANQIAHALHARGARPGALIGLHLERSVDMLAAQLGVMKAGCAYVPLDPAYPTERLAYMASDAGLALLISHGTLALALGWPRDRCLLLDADAPQVNEMPRGNLHHVDGTVHSELPAYVIYTSGSTGKPKGVVVPHRAVINFLHSMARRPGLAADDVLVAVTTLSFDIAVTELLLPLTVGARIVLASREEAGDASLLRGLIDSHRVNVMQATPATWRLLLSAGWTGGTGFKALCGGEPLDLDLAHQLLERTGSLWNMYGPTETTVWSTCARVERGCKSIDIGQPIDNTAIWIVDERAQLCPVGVPGEIMIGGESVTTGYLNRRELTDARFVADPFSGAPGALLYRTGDRGRWRAGGVLEHLGRTDFQVKVRGYRIELGEIETTLLAHASVERAVVVTQEHSAGDVRLVAYIVPRTGQSLDEASIRTHLKATLPDYMLPQHLVKLVAIPLLPNGKVDRQALPRPESAAGGASKSRVAPRTPVEQQVLTAMEDVLKLPGLGVHDDFFALGGHSLLAAQLAARLNTELAINLPMRTIFEAPSAEGLARAAQAVQQRGEPVLAAIAHRPALHEAPLTVMQERIRFMEELYPGRVVYNTPSAHRLTGPLQRPAFEQALGQMLQRQPGLRTVIARGTAEPVQRVLPELDYRLPFEDLSDLPEAGREAELMRRMQGVIDQPIDLHQAPLFRAGLFRMEPQAHVFLFMPHHIIWDGWSFDLLYREMAALYPAAVQQVPAQLPAVPVSYLDYAHWHAQWMTSDECGAQVRFWKQRYARVGRLRALPTDRPRGAGMSGTGAVEWVHVDKGLTERLRDVARQHDATLNMLVMAVYAAMLSEALGTHSLVLGVPVRGRLNSEVESVMGFFNNLLPTPLDVDRSLSMKAWIGAVKRELLDSFANQEVPFERLAAEPEIALHANKAGLYQSLFSFQDARERERHWGALSHSSVLVMQKGATEDFGLWLMEVPAGLEGGINYNADLFDASTAQIFRERLVALLQRVAGAPDIGVAALLAEPGADKASFDAWVQARRDGAGVPAPLRRAAPGPEAGGTAAEERLASIWARLLGINAANITAHDNFFDIGGNSLLVMQAVAAGESELGLRVDPRRYVHEPLGPLARGTTLPGANVRQDELARVWAELLGVDRSHIQAGDNFFDLGGSSLLAMRAVAEAERQLGLKVDPRRYVYESLQQLSVPASDEASAVAVPLATGQARPPSGLFSRVLGRLGRRP